MYFHLTSHVYACLFKKQMVILDLKKNQYILIDEDTSVVISNILKTCFDKEINFSRNMQNDPINYKDIIRKLQQKGIITSKENILPDTKYREEVRFSPGASNVDWRMDYGDLYKKSSVRNVLEAYLSLIKVCTILKLFGFNGLIKHVRSKKTKPKKNNISDLKSLSVSLNKAAFYFPIKTKCLEWASSLVLMGLKKGYRCNLEIGIQTGPFLAHAWVKSKHGVVADDTNLPHDLSVILSEPFKVTEL